MEPWLNELIETQEDYEDTREHCKSKGTWLENRGLVEVVQPKGRLLFSCGQTLQGKLYLFPEEALDLLLRRCLDVGRCIKEKEENGNDSEDTMVWYSKREFVNLMYQNNHHPNVPSKTCLMAYMYLVAEGYIARRRKVEIKQVVEYNVPQVCVAGHVWNASDDSNRNRIAFDVYEASSTFRRSAPGPALFSALICAYEDTLPTFHEMQKIVDSNDEVPVKILVVDDENSFLLFDIGFGNVVPTLNHV